MRARPYKYLFPGQKLHGQMQPLRALDVRAGRQSPKCQTAAEKPPSSGGFFGGWGRGLGRQAEGRRPALGAWNRSDPGSPLTADAGAGRGRRHTRDPGPWPSPVSSTKFFPLSWKKSLT